MDRTCEKSNPAPGRPAIIQCVVDVTQRTSVSSKISAILENATSWAPFCRMETCKLSQYCPKQSCPRVNRHKRLTARILQLRHPLYLPGCLIFFYKLLRSWRLAQYQPQPKEIVTGPRRFRPTNSTFVVCKIFETILKENLFSHLSQRSLLTTRQHDFVPRRWIAKKLPSAEETFTRWLGEGNTADIVNLDFIVNHRFLLTK